MPLRVLRPLLTFLLATSAIGAVAGSESGSAPPVATSTSSGYPSAPALSGYPAGTSSPETTSPTPEPPPPTPSPEPEPTPSPQPDEPPTSGEPDPTEPDPTEPDPSEPDPTEPDPSEPDPTEPDPSVPSPDEPRPTPSPTPGERDPEPTPDWPSEPYPIPYPIPYPVPTPGEPTPYPAPAPGEPAPTPGEPEPTPGDPEQPAPPSDPEPAPGDPEQPPGEPPAPPSVPEPTPGDPEPAPAPGEPGEPGEPTPTPGEPAPAPGEPEPTPGDPPTAPTPPPSDPSPPPSDPAPTPGDPPSDPSPPPSDPAPTPGDPEPTPGDPPSDPTPPSEPAPTPGDPAPTPGDPEPTPGDPEPTPGDPEPTPGDPPSDPTPPTTDPEPTPGDPPSPTPPPAPPALRIVTEALDEGWVHRGYSSRLYGTDGTAPYTWSIVDGSLPAGVVLDGNRSMGVVMTQGSVLGEPGIWTVVIELRDSVGATDRRRFALLVNDGRLRITTRELTPVMGDRGDGDDDDGGSEDDGDPYASYDAWLDAEGGTPPYRWETILGAWPEGIALASDGLITGATWQTGRFPVEVRVTDAAGATATCGYLLRSLGDLPRLRWLSSTRPVVGESFHAAATVIGGHPPYRLSLAGGSLPPGTWMDPYTGAFGGMPLQAGVWIPTIAAHDSEGQVSTSRVFLSVTGPPPEVRPSDVIHTAVGYDFSVLFSFGDGAQGTDAGKTWTLENGRLPPGVVLGYKGIGGRPADTGDYDFTIRMTERLGRPGTWTQAFSVRVHCSSPTLRAASQLGAADVGHRYVASLGSVRTGSAHGVAAGRGYVPGGWATSTFNARNFNDRIAVVGGQLPPGLAMDAKGVISGTPSLSGVFDALVEAGDDFAQYDRQWYRIEVRERLGRIDTRALPGARVGVHYRAPLAVFDGEDQPLGAGPAGYRWSALGLPAGLAIDQNGVIQGAPCDPGEVYANNNLFSVRITLENLQRTHRDVTTLWLTVTDDRLSFAGPDLQEWFIVRPEGFQLDSRGGGFDHVLTATAGLSDMPGVAMTPGGFVHTFSGTEIGAHGVRLEVTDEETTLRHRAQVIDVLLPHFRILTRGLPNGYEGEPYGEQIHGSGTPPYRFVIVAGSLPQGLQLSPDGLVTGTPWGDGPSQALVLGQDANGMRHARVIVMSVKGHTCERRPPGGVGWLPPAFTENDRMLAQARTLNGAKP